jgi:hypothetical protein
VNVFFCKFAGFVTADDDGVLSTLMPLSFELGFVIPLFEGSA